MSVAFPTSGFRRIAERVGNVVRSVAELATVDGESLTAEVIAQ